MMTRHSLKDYSGAFDPDFRYEDLSREALVSLLREWGLYVHLLSQAVGASAYINYGPEAAEKLSIDEWRGASPIATQRIRTALNIGGDDVPAIFKSLQLDPGFVQQYMDVRFEVVNSKRGYFELDYCGALEDAESAGEETVVRVCHHIEDATFSPTIQAVNPRAKVRAVHRPPRKNKRQKPVCRWEVWIEDEAVPDEESYITGITRQFSAARFEFDKAAGSPGGD